MNVLIITGNLTKDAELRYTNDGKAVCGFDVANNQGFGDKAHTEYYKCSLWGKRAESLAEHLTKGKQLTIQGQHRTDKRDYGGKTYFDNKVFVDEIAFGGSSNSGSDRSNQQNPTSPTHDPSAKQANPQGGGFDDDLDSLPF